MTPPAPSFATDRLRVGEWHAAANHIALTDRKMDLPEIVCRLLTPAVTASLPTTWRGAFTRERAVDWIADQDQQATNLLVTESESGDAIGLVILFIFEEQFATHIRLGYLLAESAWHRGFATELLQGFCRWCHTNQIASVVGGVERTNVASQRVLKKVGFVQLPASDNDEELIFEWRHPDLTESPKQQ